MATEPEKFVSLVSLVEHLILVHGVPQTGALHRTEREGLELLHTAAHEAAEPDAAVATLPAPTEGTLAELFAAVEEAISPVAEPGAHIDADFSALIAYEVVWKLAHETFVRDAELHARLWPTNNCHTEIDGADYVGVALAAERLHDVLNAWMAAKGVPEMKLTLGLNTMQQYAVVHYCPDHGLSTGHLSGIE